MEPFGAAASAIAVIQIADRVITLCKAYIQGVKDYPTDLRRVLIEVSGIKSILEVIEVLKSTTDREDEFLILSRTQGPLDSCGHCLTVLEALFPPTREHNAQGKRQKLALSSTRLAWPFKKEKAQAALDELGRHKSTLSLVLMSETVHNTKVIRSDVSDIRHHTSLALNEDILRSLITTDPSPNHNSACDLRESHTCEWLTRSPEYHAWKHGTSRLIWLHGIPGSGKTVLLSYVAEDVKKCCEKSQGVGCAYYYCYFARSQDETNPFLQWVIAQLSRQLGEITPDLHKQFLAGSRPTTCQLISILASIASRFRQVYVVIDALDESQNRYKFLNMLDMLLSNSASCIHFLVTSRRERDIEVNMPTRAVILSMCNSYVDEDIRILIDHKLHTEPQFRRWPPKLSADTQAALTDGAKGMFRWAVCQLEILQRLRTEAEIRLALKTLPRTLDETYERILCSIPIEDQELVSKSLQLVPTGCFSTLEGFHEALAFDLTELTFKEEAKPLSIHDAIEACACLIATDGLRLAHYTVKEFLTSSRILCGRASRFAFTNDDMNFHVASCCTAHIIRRGSCGIPYVHPLDNVVESYWWYYLTRAIESELNMNRLSPLLLELFNPSSNNFKEVSAFLSRGFVFLVPPDVPQGFGNCLALAYLCALGSVSIITMFCDKYQARLDNLVNQNIFWFYPRNGRRVHSVVEDDDIEISRDWLDYLNSLRSAHMGGTIFHWLMSLPWNQEVVQLLLDHGADLNAITFAGMSPMTVLFSAWGFNNGFVSNPHFAEPEIEIALRFLTDNGAHGNNETVLTPLQLLIHRVNERCYGGSTFWSEYIGMIERFLDTGIDINGIAKDELNVQRIQISCRHLFGDYGRKAKFPASVLGEDSFLQSALEQRGSSTFYDTPLRLLDDIILLYEPWVEVTACEELRSFLIERGAVSLHLFPIQGMPGYVEEDMEEWQALQTGSPDGATAESHAVSTLPSTSDDN